MDVELVARRSLSSLQKGVDDDFLVSPSLLDDWTWGNLRNQFKLKSLEGLFMIYRKRLENGYMSLFVVLQLILGVVHCLILISKLEIGDIAADLITCGVTNALLFPIIAMSFNSETSSVNKKTHQHIYISCLIIAILVVSDLTVAIYYAVSFTKNDHSSHHTFDNDKTNTHHETLLFRPVYATYTLLVCYIFLPLSSNLHAFILGVTASFCYLTGLLLITYRNEADFIVKITTDVMYHTCVNCLGLYFRLMNEVMIRRSFLDRRKCVESTLRLNYEKDQEEQLTRSILPPHFAAKIKKNFRDISKFIEEHKKFPSQEEANRSSNTIAKDTYVEVHENVSILYADIVNFSGLTVTLPVKKLVKTLNDLFGKFDEASERHNVLRIKFLGDCYYCISGVPIPNSEHAKSCVELGLDMIRIINEVRARVQQECGVDVNMRIGVHSGKIISGILGMNKWQYDVWSRDTIIANKMEQTGEAGKVHVTQQTLDLLDVELYNCKPVQKNDQVLMKYGVIRSYLITPRTLSTCTSTNDLKFRVPSDDEGSTSEHYSLRRGSYRRRIHFMDSYLRDYHMMLKQADAEMEKAIEHMPLSKWEQWRKWGSINPLLLTFSQLNWEIPYLREPDPLFKFYIASAALVLLFTALIIFIPMSARADSCWTVASVTISSYVITLAFIILLIPVTWTQFFWGRYKESHDDGIHNQMQPENRILAFFYRMSVKIVWNELLRIGIYFVITVMIAMTAVFNLLLECKHEPIISITTNVTEPGFDGVKCVATPWQFTQTCALAIMTTFLFLRIHFILKLFAAISIATFYSWCIYDYRSFIFEFSNETWNPRLDPQLSHVLTVGYLVLTLHLIDRQAEYLNRLDYEWKRQLTKEQNEAFHTRNANKLLLRNILPEHVADFYLNMDRIEENTLYHESHDHVAVMFATLTDLSIDESNILCDFNEIICQFDKLLFEPNYICRVEKIKLAGTTYMAACGLEISRRHSAQNFCVVALETKYNVVRVMVEFAVDLMKVLRKMKLQSDKPYELRIGVSFGEVTAGVVGAQKPLYDIWGDAVNMASRMDTTGIPGKIQVTKHTATLLEDGGVKCDLRDTQPYVKPIGNVTTYFVSLNEKMEIVQPERDEDTHV